MLEMIFNKKKKRKENLIFSFCTPILCLLVVDDNVNDDGDDFLFLEYMVRSSLFCSDAIFFFFLVAFFFYIFECVYLKLNLDVAASLSSYHLPFFKHHMVIWQCHWPTPSFICIITLLFLISSTVAVEPYTMTLFSLALCFLPKFRGLQWCLQYHFVSGFLLNAN